MPQKNSVKHYYENGFYHIYNRGVEKRDIFLDRDDYLTFLHLLKMALSPAPKQGATLKVASGRLIPIVKKNFYLKMDLLAFCLMPNHFHFLIRQTTPTVMTEFMRSICTCYAMYFNKKYERVGSLFQGIFKAVDIDDENYLLWVSRYIHRNPDNFQNYLYSSYGDYLGERHTAWLNTKPILDCFSSAEMRKIPNYQKFVGDEIKEPIDLNFLVLEK
ncbi:MAG: transposase [Patescibacteria group bacterium]|nr:transposase [Patescibacteria group bacterium]MCL5431488.1 transposase [Patescibacteria group bacterium]